MITYLEGLHDLVTPNGLCLASENIFQKRKNLTCKIEVQYTFASLTSENAMYSANFEIPREIKNLTGVKIRTRNLPTESCLLVAVPIRTVVVGLLLSHQTEIFGNIFCPIHVIPREKFSFSAGNA